MTHRRNFNATKINFNATLVFTQVTLCWQDPNVNASAPILKEAAGVAWDILNAVQIVKSNKNAFHQLAYHAADLIVVIWRSYNKTKAPKDWLSPQLQYILQELLENLNSILEFIHDKVSMNAIVRLMCTANDIDTIQRYHDHLKQAIDKFEVQSHINTSRLLAQILKKQERISDQIQRRNDAKNIISKSNVNDHQTKPKRQVYSIDVEGKSTTATVSLDVATTLPVPERMARSERAKITTDAEGTTRKSAYHRTENPDALLEGFSERENQSDEQDDEVFPTINTSRTNLRAGHSSKPIHSSSTTRNQPWAAHDNHGTSSGPSFSFTNSGGGVTINQGIGNVTYSNISNVGNDRSENYYYD